MTLIEVTDKRSEKNFLDVARFVYEGDKIWVCPLDKDIQGVFDPDQNSYFKHGIATRWVLKNIEGQLIGRIAAFIDHNSMDDYDQPTGGCGFFECINDQAAADMLFNAAKTWLESKGIEAMNGPINFGETDKYWGLLVDGFTHPSYNVPYNPPYYQKLFETYGFKLYFGQEGFHLNVHEPLDERFKKIATRISSNPEYSFKHFSYKHLDKFVADFIEVFNTAWKDFKKDFEPLEAAYVRKFLKDAKMILEEKFIWIAYNNDKPIAIHLMIPDVNQLFKPFNGKLNLWNKLRVVYGVKTKKMTRTKGILMGVVPKFQSKGVESGFFIHLEKAFRELPQYSEMEFSWVADFNPPMRKLWVAIGAKPAKKYITYRYLFNPEAEFKRYPLSE